MKKVLLSGVLLASLLSSCQEKNYVCNCKMGGGVEQNVFFSFINKKEAKNMCKDAETEFKKSNSAATCSVTE